MKDLFKKLKKLLYKKVHKSCTTCRFGNGGKYDNCTKGSYYAELGLYSKRCYEGEFWETKEN